jgi:hypothetical protein
MSDYVLLDSGGDVKTYPYSLKQLRKDNPNTSFPASPTEAMLAEVNVYPANITTASLGANQKLSYATTPVLVSGSWVLAHTATAMSEDEIASRDETLAINVRSERDARLALTDWRAGSDLTLPSAWATYRQALRDVPAQGGFPNSVTWPTEPS